MAETSFRNAQEVSALDLLIREGDSLPAQTEVGFPGGVSGPISHHSWDFSWTKNIDSNKSAGFNKGDMLGFQEDIMGCVSVFLFFCLVSTYSIMFGPSWYLRTQSGTYSNLKLLLRGSGLLVDK